MPCTYNRYASTDLVVSAARSGATPRTPLPSSKLTVRRLNASRTSASAATSVSPRRITRDVGTSIACTEMRSLPPEANTLPLMAVQPSVSSARRRSCVASGATSTGSASRRRAASKRSSGITVRSPNCPSASPSMSGAPATSHSCAAPRVTLRNGRRRKRRARTSGDGTARGAAARRCRRTHGFGVPSVHWASLGAALTISSDAESRRRWRMGATNRQGGGRTSNCAAPVAASVATPAAAPSVSANAGRRAAYYSGGRWPLPSRGFACTT